MRADVDDEPDPGAAGVQPPGQFTRDALFEPGFDRPGPLHDRTGVSAAGEIHKRHENPT
jgi:hypothetical protein